MVFVPTKLLQSSLTFAVKILTPNGATLLHSRLQTGQTH
jgi:hypothetical protein